MRKSNILFSFSPYKLNDKYDLAEACSIITATGVDERNDASET